MAMLNTSHLIEPVQMIVLTGGPCSGKSSSLAYLTEKLSDHGFMVFVIPETATLITNNGIDRRKMDRPKQVMMYEEAILEMQLSFEETYSRAVSRIFPEKRKVILLDRGVMDIKAFVPREDFRDMLKRKGLKEVKLRDRYNGVVHLVTAADGAVEYYTGENNKARIETPEEAIRLDERIRESWLGHPHFRIVDNRTDFEGKIRRTFAAISQMLGLPARTTSEERFLVDGIRHELLPPHKTIEIEQIYVRSRDRNEEIRVRKRGQEGAYLYFLTRTRTAGIRIKEEELIDEQEYLNLKRLVDPKTEVLLKDRICFLWNHQHFELDAYKGKHEGLAVLQTQPWETTDGATSVDIPPFVTVSKNITGNHRYDERNLAARKRSRLT
jgi:CYTH domain-containing protein/predicted ATPase